ncbi:MAG: TIGR02206 family membrane protein [Candidatus Limivicinus sp.]
MNSFFASEGGGFPWSGFKHFGFGHFLWLFVGGTGLVLGCFAYRKSLPERRPRLRLLTAGLALALELGRAGLLMSRGQYDLGRLPLHLCSLSIYLCFLHALTGWPGLAQFLYAFTLPGAACALLFPDWAGQPLCGFITVSSFLLHFLLVLYPLMQVAAGDLRPELRRLPGCVGWMLLLALPVYFLNKCWNTNYMFLNLPPAGSPLALFASLGAPGYLLGYLPLALGIWALLYGRELWRRLRKI